MILVYLNNKVHGMMSPAQADVWAQAWGLTLVLPKQERTRFYTCHAHTHERIRMGLQPTRTPKLQLLRGGMSTALTTRR